MEHRCPQCGHLLAVSAGGVLRSRGRLDITWQSGRLYITCPGRRGACGYRWLAAESEPDEEEAA